VQAKIAAREEKLAPVYTQIASEFADLHDRSGRMEAKGVIRKSLEWRHSREFFYWRVRRLLLEEECSSRIRQVAPAMTKTEARARVLSWMSGMENDDKAAVVALEGLPVDDYLQDIKVTAVKRELKRLYEELPEDERASALK